MSAAYVAYYRVSTDKQGVRGLGMEAQREAVTRFIESKRGHVLAEFVEVESGKNNERPQLLAALDACRKHRATLLIAKLDRLARRVSFIAGLMESDVKFLAADYPEAPDVLLHMLAAFAEHERKMISERTKAAMRQAKAQGRHIGARRPQVGLAAARAVHDAKREPVIHQARPVAKELRAEGRTFREIAGELEARGIPTPRGRRWYPSSVRNLLTTPMTTEIR